MFVRSCRLIFLIYLHLLLLPPLLLVLELLQVYDSLFETQKSKNLWKLANPSQYIWRQKLTHLIFGGKTWVGTTNKRPIEWPLSPTYENILMLYCKTLTCFDNKFECRSTYLLIFLKFSEFQNTFDHKNFM